MGSTVDEPETVIDPGERFTAGGARRAGAPTVSAAAVVVAATRRGDEREDEHPCQDACPFPRIAHTASLLIVSVDRNGC